MQNRSATTQPAVTGTMNTKDTESQIYLDKIIRKFKHLKRALDIFVGTSIALSQDLVDVAARVTVNPLL